MVIVTNGLTFFQNNVERYDKKFHFLVIIYLFVLLYLPIYLFIDLSIFLCLFIYL